MSILEVKDLRKTFGKTDVLKGISFSLEKGEVLSIIGSSGSGKTTLLNIIGGLEKADGGKIIVDGESMKGNEDKIRNQKIGFIFQNYYLERGYTISEIMRNAMLIAGFTDEKEIERRTE